MPGDLNRDVEAVARRQLTRLIDAIAVDDERRPAAFFEDRSPDPVERSSKKRGRWLAAAAAVALLVGGSVVASRLAPDDEPEYATGDEDACGEDEPTDPYASESADSGEPTVVARGDLADGRPWEYLVFDPPPGVNERILLDGETSWETETLAADWDAAVRVGLLTWSVQRVGDELVVSGQLPVEAAYVEVGLPDGATRVLCPAAVPGVVEYRYAAGVLPVEAEAATLTAKDRGGRVVAQGSVGELGLTAAMEIVPEHVMLPFGGPWDLFTDELPSGRSWMLTGERESSSATYVLRFDGGIESQVGVQSMDGPLEGIDKPLFWTVQVVDGGYVVWGLVPDQIASVQVGLDDGERSTGVVLDAGLPGLSTRAFVAVLPEGASFGQVLALNAESQPEFYAADVTDGEEIAVFREGSQTTLSVKDYGDGPTMTIDLSRD